MTTTSEWWVGRWKIGSAALFAGAALWGAASMLQLGGMVELVPWLAGPGIILIGLGHLAIAFSRWNAFRHTRWATAGTVALMVAAAGWIFFGVGAILAPMGMESVLSLTRALTLAAEVVAAVAILIAAPVTSVARWILLVPAGWMIVGGAIEFVVDIDVGWNTLILSVAFLATGIAYIGLGASNVDSTVESGNE